MGKGRFASPWRRLGGALGVSVALVLTIAMVAPAPAATTCTDAQKPAVFPEDQLQPGMTATGFTVIQGTTPQSFDGDILGVLHDAVLPGIDIILVKLSGSVIDQTGGAAFGMSGSPFFINNQFVGALIFGPPDGYGDQTIAGLMPAQHIVDLFDYPSATSSARMPRVIHLSAAARRSAARVARTSASQMPSTLQQLRLPLAVSGLNGRGMNRFNRVLRKLNLPVFAYRASSASAPTQAAATQLQPGDAASAVLSYGDLSAGGIGTVAAVCGNDDILFGHPFFFDGATTMGLNGANILTVVKDPSGLIGPYKVGEITEAHGTLDQDRLAGLRGTEGALPPTAPVTSSVSNPDLGTSRDGETDVVLRGAESSFDLFPSIAPFAILAEQDVVFDRIGAGTDTMSWTLTGTTKDGENFSLSRDNMIWSPFDSSFEGILELLSDLFVISNNPFEHVTFTDLDWTGSMTTEQNTTTISKVLVATPEDPTFAKRRHISVRPGDKIRLHIELLPFGEDVAKTVKVEIQVPHRRGGGALIVRGGQGAFFGGGGKNASFDDLLAKLQGAEHNTDLVVELNLGARRRGAAQSEQIRRSQDLVVIGGRAIFVQVGGGFGGGGTVVTAKPGPAA